MKKTAEDALARNEELEQTIKRYGLSTLADREQQLRLLDAQLEEKRGALAAVQSERLTARDAAPLHASLRVVAPPA